MNATINALKRQLWKYGIHLSKQRGQSLLLDEAVLDALVSACELTNQDVVIEIGAGTGVLTAELAKRAKQVYALEIDKRMFQLASDTLRGYNNLTLIQDDVLKYNFAEVVKAYPDEPIKFAGNLPYSITSPILIKVVETQFPFALAVFMIQKEVAERLVASPGTKDYGILTIAIAYRCQPEMIRVIPAKSFFPVPEVDSAIIKLVQYKTPPVQVDDEKFFFRIVKVAFGQRRKTLLNNLSTISHQLGINKQEIEKVLLNLKIEPQRRGETLSLAEFAKLANQLNRQI
ncbi:MAG: 16S rRNA (adenine(1518)-N(6)/adenine(1519)-N(6))-dimethyltransferase RsmA [bacterium]|nr:16S rRNA (adenine(1518)-N(6)/adenine(1519)-N(6))-dimethyltransferase RsmA [bacterium]